MRTKTERKKKSRKCNQFDTDGATPNLKTQMSGEKKKFNLKAKATALLKSQKTQDSFKTRLISVC